MHMHDCAYAYKTSNSALLAESPAVNGRLPAGFAGSVKLEEQAAKLNSCWKNSLTACRAKVQIFHKSTVRARPKPGRVWAAYWTPGPNINLSKIEGKSFSAMRATPNLYSSPSIPFLRRSGLIEALEYVALFDAPQKPPYDEGSDRLSHRFHTARSWVDLMPPSRTCQGYRVRR
ncbi:hypothetical protein PGTUg99_013777 [Puccinia graminis f. sp. tritici]|uniref:Uncharacterized protein n=1 Tax=Puccinia graminis f. sp. tritici TaxID=56615 RepID=A0A5B0NT38_PUCGR|nr:hypothetical protein PGTUg99_013777 [Puccinia graminis f. sp. tritici]